MQGPPCCPGLFYLTGFWEGMKSSYRSARDRPSVPVSLCHGVSEVHTGCLDSGGWLFSEGGWKWHASPDSVLSAELRPGGPYSPLGLTAPQTLLALLAGGRSHGGSEGKRRVGSGPFASSRQCLQAEIWGKSGVYSHKGQEGHKATKAPRAS